MFTGIIEEIGRVKNIRLGRTPVIEIEASEVSGDLKIGDSVSVNGVCLTVTSVGRGSFTADVMPETLKKTDLGFLKKGSSVNLERALKAGDRMGGHMVSGHIDGVAKIKRVSLRANSRIITIEAPKEMTEFVVSKGSVALDGISLTVVDVEKTGFTVSLIPQTLTSTTLGAKKAGSKVNIEVDMVAKLVRK